MRSESHKSVIRIMREQYESIIYTTLIESELKEREIMDAAGLEVTRSKDGSGGKKGDKFTIHSVERRANNQVIVRLISPENVTGPITSAPADVNQPTQEYTLEEFESNFDI